MNAPVTIFLMAAILLMAIISSFNRKIRLNLVLHPFSVLKQQEYYRLVSADFIHNDFIHLALNEYLLYAYGANLEDYLNASGSYGSLKFAVIYLISCLSGTIVTTMINRKNFGFSSAGASGSIMGCLFGYVILRPKRVALYLPVFGSIINLYWGLICILLIIIYTWKSQNDLISEQQHFFGALGGIMTTLLLVPGIIK